MFPNREPRLVETLGALAAAQEGSYVFQVHSEDTRTIDVYDSTRSRADIMAAERVTPGTVWEVITSAEAADYHVPESQWDDGQTDRSLYEVEYARQTAVLRARDDAATAAASQARGPLTVHTRSTLNDLPEVWWHVDGFLPHDAVVFVYGDAGMGKSALLLELIASSLTGGRFLDTFQTRPASWLYVAGEGVSGFRSRIAAVEQKHGIELADDAFALVTDGVSLSDPASVDDLCLLVVQRDVDVVVLDTYSQLAGLADENDASGNANALRQADRIRKARPGTSVIIVHHAGKDSEKGMRGSSVQKANVDYVWAMRRDGDGLMLSTLASHGGKARHSAPSKVTGFKLGEAFGSVVIVADDPTPEWLRDVPAGTTLTLEALRGLTGKSDAQTRRLVSAAVEAGYLTRVAHGTYAR